MLAPGKVINGSMNLYAKRLPAIDLFRSITMLMMIFVNDVAGVGDIPKWIRHTAAHEDGMGFSDTIFPAFLFIVGLSIPLAIGNRIARGDSFLSIAGHIFLRSAALIVMGFFHVNLENYNDSAAWLPRDVWAISITIAFFLVWLDYPRTMPKVHRYILTGTGIALLAVMACLYRGGTGDHPEPMQPHWWGILGLIGWAYLICAAIFLLLKGNSKMMPAVLFLLMAVNIASHAGWMPFDIPILGDASSATLIMSGVVVTLLYKDIAGSNRYARLWLALTIAAILLMGIGFFIRPYTGGISKIMATPAWVFICTAISILMLEICIWIADIRGQVKIFSLIKPAGTSTLTCYLLPYLLYSIYELAGFEYPAILNHGIGGIVRSLAVAFIIVAVAGLLERKRIRLKI